MVSQSNMLVNWLGFHKQPGITPPIRICKKVYVCGFERLLMLVQGSGMNESMCCYSAKVGKLMLNGFIDSIALRACRFECEEGVGNGRVFTEGCRRLQAELMSAGAWILSMIS